MKTIQRAVSLCLSLAIILMSPGLASFAAAADVVVRVNVAAPAGRTAGPVALNLGAGANALPLSSSLSGNLFLQGAVPTLSAPGAIESQTAGAVEAVAVAAVQEAVVSKAAEVSSEVSAVLENAGEISKAQPSRASGLGHALQALLTGKRFSPRSDLAASIDAQGLGSISKGSSLVRPSAENASNDSAVPAPPKGGGGNSDNPGNSGGPLWAKLLSGSLALTPAIFIGWPLIASGALLSGGLVIAASLGLASMPFMSDATPKSLRAIPGVLLGVLGLGAAAGAFFAPFSWPALAMGALVTLGGWGFTRFARKGGKGNINDSQEVIGTFFGALAATTGAGLVLLSPAGWLAGGLTVLAYPVSLILLVHLPGWVGEALASAFRGLYLTVKDVYKVLSSIRRDTVLRQRLVKYTEASIEKSAWSALTLGLLLWLPVVVSEATQFVLAAAAGTVLGVVRAPLMLLWGASHHLAKDSKATKFLAAWASWQFGGSKAKLFNRFESKLIPYANSKNKIVSVLGASGIRALQLGWLAYTIVMTPLAWAVGLVHGFKEAGKAYDPKRHDPDELDMGEDELDGKIPSEPAPVVGNGSFAKVLAAAIGLAPVWFFAVPLIAEGWLLAALAGGAALSIAAMPLMPQTDVLPAGLRRLPGTILTFAGAYTLYQAGVLMFIGLPAWGLAAMGALAVFGGVGLSTLIGKLRDKQTKAWRLNEPEYILGYAGALAVSTGLLVSLLGVGGPLGLGLSVAAYVLSPALLYHLPRWLWSGVGDALGGFLRGIENVWKVMRFWTRDTEFNRNLKRFYDYCLDKSFWTGPLLLLPWAVSLVAWLGETAVSLALGLAVGVLRAPTRFFWGAAQEKNRDGSWARFWSGYHRFMTGLMEGSKKTAFDPLVKGLASAMNDKDAVSSRPTLKALVAFTGARFVQLYWLARLAVLVAATPLLVPFGIYHGIKNARSSATDNDPDQE